jgi:hypothetical protein
MLRVVLSLSKDEKARQALRPGGLTTIDGGLSTIGY